MGRVRNLTEKNGLFAVFVKNRHYRARARSLSSRFQKRKTNLLREGSPYE